MTDVILFRPRLSGLTARALAPRMSMGLLFVASRLVENNYKVKIIDEETNFYWLEELNKALGPSTICVGISAMTGRQILGGLNFAKIVKDKFDIPVVWGGMHASMLPEQTIKSNLVDIAVRGEGEESLLKIVNSLKRGENPRDIPNVWYKENGEIRSNPQDQFIDLDSLPPLPYDLLDCEKYTQIERVHFPNSKRIMDLQTDRGCPHRCGFCYNININKRKWRAFSTSRVIEQIEYLVKKFSLDGIDFVADNFFVDKNRVARICSEIIKRKIKIAWHADCRIDYFAKYEDSFIDLLKQSGCQSLTFGIESGSPKILNLIHKDINLDEIFKVNEKLKKWQLRAGYHFMAGFPGENKKDLLQTYDLMLKLYDRYPHADFLGPSIYTPYPGTPLYHKCLEMGFRAPEKLEEWAKFDWVENPPLPFLSTKYSEWIKKSANIAKRGSIKVRGLSWICWWYRFRTRIIVKFKVIGPQPEEGLIRLIHFAKGMVIFVKKLFKIK